MSKRDEFIKDLKKRYGLSTYEATLAIDSAPNADRVNEATVKRGVDLVVQDWGGVDKIKSVAAKQKPLDDEEARRIPGPGRDKTPEEMTAAERAAAGVDKSGDQSPLGEVAHQLGVEPGELSDALPDDLEAILAGGPEAVDTRGAPLWPFEGSPESLSGLTVKDRTRSTVDQGERDSRRGRPWLESAQGVRTGARYFEQDTLEPLKWSAEQRADLQRVLQGIGLYGDDAKVRLGSWTAKDQAIYAELLAAANVEGLTWAEMLSTWKRNPPADLLDAAKNGGRAPLVVQHTNPIDVAQTAEQVSRSLIGRVDRGFAEGTVGGYAGAETAAQTAAYNAAKDGGTVTDAPSVQAFAADQLRRTDGAEVDSYSTLGAFNEVLRQLGLAG